MHASSAARITHPSHARHLIYILTCIFPSHVIRRPYMHLVLLLFPSLSKSTTCLGLGVFRIVSGSRSHLSRSEPKIRTAPATAVRSHKTEHSCTLAGRLHGVGSIADLSILFHSSPVAPHLHISLSEALFGVFLSGASQHDAVIGPTHGARAQPAARSTASPRRTEAAMWKARCGSARL